MDDINKFGLKELTFEESRSIEGGKIGNVLSWILGAVIGLVIGLAITS